MDTPQQSRAPLLITALAMLLLPGLYVLSVGPAVYLYHQDVISGEVFATVYKPVLWIYAYGPEPLSAALSNYVTWWERLSS